MSVLLAVPCGGAKLVVGEVHEKKHELVKALLLALPKANYCLLKLLMEFFLAMSKHEKATKMGIVNCATLIGPNLIWAPKRDCNDISTPTKISWFMMTYAEGLFGHPDKRDSLLLAVGRSKYDYTAEDKTQVNLRAGDVLFIMSNDDGHGWMSGTTARSLEQGKFPSRYFEMIEAFSGFELEPLLSASPAHSSRPSTVSSSASEPDGALLAAPQSGDPARPDPLEELRRGLAAESAARAALEDHVNMLQENLHDILQIVIAMKARQKDFEAQLASNPFEDAREE